MDWGGPDREPRPRFYDDRLGSHGYGVNGHVNLTFAGPRVTALYVDLEGQELLEESWVAKEGQVVLDSQRQIIADRDFHGPRLT